MRSKLIVEFIGTFFLVLVIGQVVVGADGLAAALAPVAIGSVLMAVVYAGGHVSGAHYNPAVTFAIWIRGKIPGREVLPYFAAQVAAAVLAAIIVNYFKSGVDIVAIELAFLPALLAEFLFTFILCFVILNVATATETAGNSYFGWAIGFTVAAGAYAVGSVSGVAFNPAVALGISVMGLSVWSNIWIYLISTFLGGAAAAYVFGALRLGSAESHRGAKTDRDVAVPGA